MSEIFHNVHRQCQRSTKSNRPPHDNVRDPRGLVGLHNVHRQCQRSTRSDRPPHDSCQRSSTMSTDSVRDPRGLVGLHNAHRQCQRSTRSDRPPHDSCQCHNNEWGSVQVCNRSLPDNERVLPVHHVKGTTPDLIRTKCGVRGFIPLYHDDPHYTTHRHPERQNCSDVSFFPPKLSPKIDMVCTVRSNTESPNVLITNGWPG